MVVVCEIEKFQKGGNESEIHTCRVGESIWYVDWLCVTFRDLLEVDVS